MILQLRQIFFTEAETFIVFSYCDCCQPPLQSKTLLPYFERNTMRARLRSYGVNSTVTRSPGRMRM